MARIEKINRKPFPPLSGQFPSPRPSLAGDPAVVPPLPRPSRFPPPPRGLLPPLPFPFAPWASDAAAQLAPSCPPALGPSGGPAAPPASPARGVRRLRRRRLSPCLPATSAWLDHGSRSSAVAPDASPASCVGPPWLLARGHGPAAASMRCAAPPGAVCSCGSPATSRRGVPPGVPARLRQPARLARGGLVRSPVCAAVVRGLVRSLA
jgi:hypothetical protein